MTKKIRRKYRLSSLRMQHWDYGSNAAYFITICTKDRICFFGQIQNAEMKWNESGQIAENIWMKIPQQFPYIQLADFVIMPNHVHGILIVDKNNPDGIDDHRRGAINRNPTSTITPSRKPGGLTGDKNPMLHENMSRVIRWYKGRCTYEIRKINPEFGWQSKFYDHIIRNDNSFQRISQYILNNPKNWHEDKLTN